MKTTARFTSASVKDHASRVTTAFTTASLGDQYIIHIRHKGRDHQILFYCNRDKTSLKTTSWPVGLPKVKVGFAVELEVLSITKI